MYQADAHSELEQLRSAYLKSLAEKTAAIAEAMRRRDFRTLTGLGHQLKGSGLSYGYAEISDLGARIEWAGENRTLLLLDPLRIELEELVNRLIESQPLVMKP